VSKRQSSVFRIWHRIPLKRIGVLVVLNAALYAGFVVFDILSAIDVPIPDPSPSNVMKYATIVSCLLITLFAASANKLHRGTFCLCNSAAQTKRPAVYDYTNKTSPCVMRRAARVQAVVFGITLAADFFLLFTDHFVVGLLVFLLAHLTALFRYKPRWVPWFAAAAGALCLAALIVGRSYHAEFQLLRFVLLCAAYAVVIGGVLAATFFAQQPRINTLFSRLGMILFLCCDVNVFFANFLSAGAAYYEPALVLMWVFYLPAQTLLALSAVAYTNSLQFTRYLRRGE
jgi:hypothetical protein